MFFNFPAFQRNVSANKHQQKGSLILQYIFAHSTHLTMKIICCRNTNKNLSYFTNFPANLLFDTSIDSIKTLNFFKKFRLQGQDCGYISHRKPVSLNIKQNDNKITNLTCGHSKNMSLAEWHFSPHSTLSHVVNFTYHFLCFID